MLLSCNAETEDWSKGSCGKDTIVSCAPPLRIKIVTIIWGVLCVCYQIVYYLYNSTARRRLERLPYGRYRTGHALLTWQVGALSQCTT